MTKDKALEWAHVLLQCVLIADNSGMKVSDAEMSVNPRATVRSEIEKFLIAQEDGYDE